MAAAEYLEQRDVGPLVWIWAGLGQGAQETADLVAFRLKVRREQVVPEFSFADARAVGAMEGRPASYVRSSLDVLDQDENARMAPGEDGTPNESVSDVFVRVRQLLSKLETQYFGDTIIIIAPDSDVLSVLECALCNVPLALHRQRFAYAPGEVRKVTPEVVDGARDIPYKRLSDVIRQ
jgi:broad specificity phosphatase PhoE